MLNLNLNSLQNNVLYKKPISAVTAYNISEKFILFIKIKNFLRIIYFLLFSR